MGASSCLSVAVTRQNAGAVWRVCRRFAGSIQTVAAAQMQQICRTGESPFSEIIDVRTSDEYSRDHLPGAVNIPILENSERQVVGAEYASDQFGARRLGAALVCQHLARHLRPGGHFAAKDAGYRPLVYCWRGGLRSRAVGEVLQHVGFHVGVLDGGYRSYRRWVRDQLAVLPGPLRLIVVSGLTGSGKSRLLELLEERGEQIVHLERLACHKGSLLGLYPGVDAQPSQRAFDSRLLQRLLSLSPSRPVWVECESRSVGDNHLPAALWQRMSEAPRVFIQATPSARTDFILRDYDYLVHDVATLSTRLRWIATFHPDGVGARWQSLVDDGDFRGLVEELLERHYDPLYRRSRQRIIACDDPATVQRIPVRSLLDLRYLREEVLPTLIDTGYRLVQE